MSGTGSQSQQLAESPVEEAERQRPHTGSLRSRSTVSLTPLTSSPRGQVSPPAPAPRRVPDRFLIASGELKIQRTVLFKNEERLVIYWRVPARFLYSLSHGLIRLGQIQNRFDLRLVNRILSTYFCRFSIDAQENKEILTINRTQVLPSWPYGRKHEIPISLRIGCREDIRSCKGPDHKKHVSVAAHRLCTARRTLENRLNCRDPLYMDFS